jgi:hypothetical protein
MDCEENTIDILNQTIDQSIILNFFLVKKLGLILKNGRQSEQMIRIFSLLNL